MAGGVNMDALVDVRGKAAAQTGGLSHSWASGSIRIGVRSRKRRSLADLRCGEEGQSLVEFALVFAFVLMPLFFGFIAFAFYLSYFESITQAVSAAGQQLSISRAAEITDPCATALTAFEGASPMHINPANASVQVLFEAKGGSSYTSVGTNTCAGTAGTELGGNTGGGSVEVIATYTYPCFYLKMACNPIKVGVTEYVY
jgi:Flp pilus assembly protein TadG